MIHVVGGGLVGSLWSVFLARKGHEVHVYERRPDMRKQSLSAGRSINLAVSTRGIAALREAGIGAEVLSEAIQMPGRMLHNLDGTLSFLPYGKDTSEHILSISRGALNKALITAAESTGKVRFHFEKKLVHADLEKKELRFRNESLSVVASTSSVHTQAAQTQTTDHASEEIIPYSSVFGTDGSASALRQSILETEKSSAQEAVLDYGYKELTLPPSLGTQRFQMEKNALHIWPRGQFMLIALPNFDGSFTCTLFLPFKGEISFEKLKDPDSILDFFEKYFPDAATWIPNLVDEFQNHPVGQMITVKCAPWSSGSALLLGDAAHAIVPFFGQGMNAGFEDLSILHPQIAGPMDSWPSAFQSFWKSRKPDADAIADLAIENFSEMKEKVADARFQFERKVEAILQKNLSGEYLSRYSMVTFSRLPYRYALEAGKIQAQILSRLCKDISQPEEVDLEQARKYVKAELTPLMIEARKHELN